jgi:predicted phosphodiesterase
MTKETPVKTEAVNLCRRFPTLPARTLARMLHRDFPQLYPTIERGRDAVRKVLGLVGQSNLRSSVPDLVRPKRNAGEWEGVPVGSREIDWRTFDVDGKARCLVLSDIHIPFHDETSLVLALKQGKRDKCDVILLNGDLMDCYKLSRWEVDPRKFPFHREVSDTIAFLETLRENFPKARIIWKLGNHEERFMNVMKKDHAVFLDVPDFDLSRLVHADRLGIEIVDDMRPVKLGKLSVLHGHEYRFSISNPVNPARGLFMRAKVSVMCSHFHQTSQHSESDLDGKVVSAWSLGCLCDLHPRYMPLNKWNIGFAKVETDNEGRFEVSNYRIVDGRIYA